MSKRWPAISYSRTSKGSQQRVHKTPVLCVFFCFEQKSWLDSLLLLKPIWAMFMIETTWLVRFYRGIAKTTQLYIPGFENPPRIFQDPWTWSNKTPVFSWFSSCHWYVFFLNAAHLNNEAFCLGGYNWVLLTCFSILWMVHFGIATFPTNAKPGVILVPGGVCKAWFMQKNAQVDRVSLCFCWWLNDELKKYYCWWLKSGDH